MKLQNFIRQLKERGAYKVAAVYAAAAWFLLGFADIVFPVMGLPDRAITFLLIAAAACFPLAVLLAWYLDWTPSGIRLTVDSAPGDDSSAHMRLREKVVVATMVGMVALVGYLYWERLTLTEVIATGAIGGASRAERAVIDPASLVINAPHNSIAILPFETMSDRPEDRYFGDGLAEEILNLLAGLRELQVAARTSSFAIATQDIELREMARKMSVRHVLEGSVRRMGEQIRVSAQLVDASTGYQLWSETYDRRFEDIFKIQDDIARQVTASLQLIIPRAASEKLRSRPTDNLESYDYYLQAKFHLRQPAEEKTLDRALALLEQSIELDPEFANARAASCSAYLAYYQLKRSSDYFKEAERACQAALVLDDADAEVYSALGKLYLASGQIEMAAVEFRRSLSLHPGDIDVRLGLVEIDILNGHYEAAESALLALRSSRPDAWLVHLRLGNFLFKTGRAAESIPSYERAIELSPENQAAYNGLGVAHFMQAEFKLATEAWRKSLSLAPSAMTYSNTGSSFFHMGDYAQAVEMYSKAVELAPRDYEYWGNLGDTQFFANLQDEAIASYRQAIELALEGLDINAENPDTTALLAHYYAAVGQSEKATELAQRALQLAPGSMYAHYDVAIAWARLGEDDKAVEMILRALELGYPSKLLAIDPNFSRLQEKIRLRQLAQRP